MKQRMIKSAVCLAAASSLTACSVTADQIGAGAGGLAGGLLAGALTENVDNDGVRLLAIGLGAAAGAYLGREIARRLTEEDQAQLVETQQKALATGQSQSFYNPQTNVRARVDVIEPDFGAVPEVREEQVEIAFVRDRVDQIPPLDLIAAPYSASSPVNVRGGPGTDYEVVGGLAAGEVVQVIGQVRGEDWYVVSEGGAANGFVYSSLLSPSQALPQSASAPSGNLGSSVVSARSECRTVRQTVEINGETLQETQELCQSGDGTWQLA